VIRPDLIRETVAESCRIEEKTLGAQIRQVCCMLDDALRSQHQALSEGQRLCGAFCKHNGRFLDLNEVRSHGRYAGRMQLQKLFVIHRRATFPVRYFDAMRHGKVTNYD
jgi:hypothetical protein